MFQQAKRFSVVLCAIAPLAACPVQADTNVSDPGQLAGALASGGTILLAAGDYGALTLTSATSGVTLRSADPAHPARFTGLMVNGASNVTLDALIFDYSYQSGDAFWTAPFAVQGSRNLTITRSRFDGDVAKGGGAADNGYPSATGLSVQGSSNVTLSGNRISNFMRGLVVDDSNKVTVSGNDITAIRTDGMDFSAVQNVQIVGNYLHDFKTSTGSDDHPDMIQIFTAGSTKPTRDVTIRDNILNSGAGHWTQSIFMGNEVVASGQAGASMFYRNITITGNVIINAHLHGITVGETEGLTITRNTVIHNRRSDSGGNVELNTPRINVAAASRNVKIQGNAVAGIAGAEGGGWNVSGNVLIQDTNPAAPNYYDTVFMAARSGNPQKLSSFAYRPGGPVDGKSVGAARLISP